MKLKFKHQRFQLDATEAVVNVFKGQAYSDGFQYRMDQGSGVQLFDRGFGNEEIHLTNEELLTNIQCQQSKHGIRSTDKLVSNDLRLTVEMETGTGKTYTYIRTMYELNKVYGWCKFIVVVPSIAIREGVLKSFEVMQDHFAQEYGKRIHFFEYDSKQLSKIDAFASDNSLHVMIINTQAFNARGVDARRIDMKLDEFRSRRPIDVIAATRPIVIIDEPQTVLGADKKNVTREKLKKFNPLFMVLYSATHRKEDICNMVYRLDAMDAYNKKLVKKIAVKGIEQIGTTGTNGFVYLEKIEIFKDRVPRAKISFEVKTKSGIKRVTKLVDEGFNLYEHSGELAAYENNYVVQRIDGRDDCVVFGNGITLPVGTVVGAVNEEMIRRIQIRETIISHLENERVLFKRGIKVLSLFFIDHVANYRQYEAGTVQPGIFSTMFEEEYADLVEQQKQDFANDIEYIQYLNRFTPNQVHAGYFSMDKKGKLLDSSEKKEDVDAFTLIMKAKERLLSFKEPVRFIFSHSALKEGWDNPNVFQICTLKNSDNETKKRQEVGRGMRLCVNQHGERQDVDVLGENGVHDTNLLTIIASESYDSFAKKLQTELAEAVTTRPLKVTAQLFENLLVTRSDGTTIKLTEDQAVLINDALVSAGYRKKTELTEKYFNDVRDGKFVLDLEANDFGQDIPKVIEAVCEVLQNVYNGNVVRIVNGHKLAEAKFREDKFRDEFNGLWTKIRTQTFYTVDFKSDELIKNAVEQIDRYLVVDGVTVNIVTGNLTEIKNRNSLIDGTSMQQQSAKQHQTGNAVGAVKYDIIGKLVESTLLTRKVIAQILTKIHPSKFDMFKKNPEDFLIKVSNLINQTKALTVVQHIAYKKLDQSYDTSIFTDVTIKGEIGVNALQSTKSLYDLVVVDSQGIEKDFAKDLELNDEVVVYTKLPRGFYINTPVGRYNPDWAIVFNGDVKHVYFVAETKGSLNSAQLREIERTKIECARRHFEAISNSAVKYDVVSNYKELYNLVTQ